MEKKNQKTKTINILLWTAQILLGVLFLIAGGIKVTQPVELLAPMMTWINHASPALVKFIGLAEVIGAFGLLLPAILRVKPALTVWAAFGLAAIMAGAIIFHLAIGEAKMIGTPIVLGSISVFIAWGRDKKAPILPKNSSVGK